MKNDKYLRKRGGHAKMIYVCCAVCGEKVLYYQKDGPGWLKRCYLNRIFGPKEFEALQHDSNIKEPKDLMNLKCSKCNALMGTPIMHKDGRLAFHLIRGSFQRKSAQSS